MHEIPRVPFPEIPRYPPTPDVAADPKPEKDNRPIEWPWDSQLLAREEELPYLTTLGRHLTAFERTPNVPAQRQQCQEIWCDLIQQPAQIPQFFSTLSLLQDCEFLSPAAMEKLRARAADADPHSDAQLQLDKHARLQDTLARFGACMEEERARMLGRMHDATVTPDTARALLSLIRVQGPDQEIGEEILMKKFSNVKDEHQTVNLIYTLAVAALESNDDALIRLIHKIIYLTTPFLTSESPGAAYYSLAHQSLDDDTLKKILELDHMVGFLGNRYLEQSDRDTRMHYLETLEKNNEFTHEVQRRVDAAPRRYTLLQRMMRATPDPATGFIKLPQQKDEFPYTLVTRHGPLRALVHERMTAQSPQEPGSGLFSFHYPGGDVSLARIPDNAPSAFDFARNAYLAHLSKEPRQPVVTEGREIDCLAYLTERELDDTRLRALAAVTAPLREDFIQHRNTALLNPSGDQVLITDEALQHMGYKDMLFQMNKKNKHETIVHVAIHHYRFTVRLDELYELQHIEPGKQLILHERAKAWLEHLIFSHLHELLCTKRAEELVRAHNHAAHGFETLALRKARSRRAHKRDLPPGESYTNAQFNHVLTTYGINLAEWNRMLGRTKETGMRTFVSETEGEESDGDALTAPVVSRAPHALDRYHRIADETPSSVP